MWVCAKRDQGKFERPACRQSTASAQHLDNLFDHACWDFGDGQVRRAKYGFHHSIGMLFDPMGAFDYIAHGLLFDFSGIGDHLENGKRISARRVCETAAR